MENTKNKDICEWCGKKLQPLEIEFNGKRRVVGYQQCSCEGAKKAQAEQEKKQKLIDEGIALQKIDSKLDLCGVKKRYRSCEHKDTDYYTNLVVNNKKDLYIYGSIGSGKTYLACSVLRDLAKRGLGFQFVRMSELLEEVLKSSNSPALWNKCLKVDYLVIDDLGKENLSEFCLSKLFDLINERYSDEKITIITSNFSPEELEKWLSSKTSNKFLPQAIMRRILNDSMLLCMDQDI